MGKFADSILTVIETISGPMDWLSEYNGDTKTFTGRFLVYDRRGLLRLGVRGRIVQRSGRVADVYLYDPPKFVGRHRHGQCLQLLHPNDKWFKLHFEKPAYDFPSAYTYVENLLTEAYRLTW